MNEQIRELMDQAGWINAYTNPKDGFEPVFEGEDRNLACIEKFAELIVRECANQLPRISEDYYTGDGIVEDAQKLILEHFGVEE